MRPSTRRPPPFHQLLLRLLLLAVVLNTLLPVWWQASGAAPGWAELCSASGTHVVPLDGAAPHAIGHAEHCIFCGTSVDPLIPALAVPASHWLAAGLAYLPPLFSLAPRSLFIWAASQARAPPASAQPHRT